MSWLRQLTAGAAPGVRESSKGMPSANAPRPMFRSSTIPSWLFTSTRYVPGGSVALLTVKLNGIWQRSSSDAAATGRTDATDSPSIVTANAR